MSRGGKREGSGRPAMGDRHKITLRLPLKLMTKAYATMERLTKAGVPHTMNDLIAQACDKGLDLL